MEPRAAAWTVKQTARFYQLSEGHVYRLLDSGELPFGVKIGSTWRIPAQAVYQHLNGDWQHKAWPAQKSAEGASLDAHRT